MKIVLVAEYRDGKLLGSNNELIAFAEKMNAESAMFLVGSEADLPAYNGKLYLADSGECGEYNPSVHKDLLLKVVEKEQPDVVVERYRALEWHRFDKVEREDAEHVDEARVEGRVGDGSILFEVPTNPTISILKT